MPRRARTVLILLLTLGLLALSLRGANLRGVWAEVRRAESLPLVLAVLATLLTYALRALRWQYLLAPIGHTHFGTAFRTTVIGFAASFLLPARAGEVIRPYLLAKRERLSATSAFATIILERLLDLLVVLLLFALFVFTAAPGVIGGDPADLARVKLGGITAVAAALAGCGVLFALAGHPERFGRLALRVEAVLPSKVARAVAHFAETFAQGLAVMRQPRRLLVSLLLSLPLWLSIAAGIWLTSQAFHITFPFTASFLVMTVLVVGVAVPTPGAICGFHAAYEFAVLTFFGAPMDRAVGGAFVLHAISFIPVTILGVLFMAGEGLTLAGARRLAEQPATGADVGPAGGLPGALDSDPDTRRPVRVDPPVGEPIKRGVR
jgi:glycosyltransferase 2 family protein